MEISSDIIRGHLEGVILKLILEKDRYGYEISSEISKRTENMFNIKEATLYALVQRLEKKELITSYIGEKSHGSKRRYYKVTTLGKAYYKEKIAEWQALKSIMSKLLEVRDERNS
ncbi:MAG: PadR family transcriptional regulator [Candidatus Izemoplasmataceae bacterium]|jgi:PadR family transcriptional regulator, regulatory protein PadR|uniref:PadR family transcriptional regulator n=1 Tax=Liberiplasma polymorphum TaxID=3374570 RepID=UPI003775452F